MAWSPGPRSTRQGAKDNLREGRQCSWWLAHPFGKIVVLLVLGAPSSSRWGMEMAVGLAFRGLCAVKEQLVEAPASWGLER